MTDAAALPDLAPLHAWFTSYCGTFRAADPEVQRNFDLKEEHTRNVCLDARLIAQGSTPRFRMLAEVAGLCHDLGRFPQFRDFQTFKDSDSLNHAHLSLQVLRQNALLDFLPDDERESVETAVRLHNVFEVPAGLPPEPLKLLRLLRDADKLDIWRVFIDYFHAPEGERPSAAGLGFPDLPGCSPETLASVGRGEMVQLSSLRTLNDFKLLQLSWIYDINFTATLRLIRQRSVLERFTAILPTEDAAVRHVLAQVRDYLEQKLAAAGEAPSLPGVPRGSHEL